MCRARALILVEKARNFLIFGENATLSGRIVAGSVGKTGCSLGKPDGGAGKAAGAVGKVVRSDGKIVRSDGKVVSCDGKFVSYGGIVTHCLLDSADLRGMSPAVPKFPWLAWLKSAPLFLTTK